MAELKDLSYWRNELEHFWPVWEAASQSERIPLLEQLAERAAADLERLEALLDLLDQELDHLAVLNLLSDDSAPGENLLASEQSIYQRRLALKVLSVVCQARADHLWLTRQTWKPA